MFYCLPFRSARNTTITSYIVSPPRGFAPAHSHPGWRAPRALTLGYRYNFPPGKNTNHLCLPGEPVCSPLPNEQLSHHTSSFIHPHNCLSVLPFPLSPFPRSPVISHIRQLVTLAYFPFRFQLLTLHFQLDEQQQ